MNLNELWSGEDYAYYSWKRRGELYRVNAPRVKIIRTFKQRVGDNDRLSGFAEVLYCDRETGEPQLYNGEHNRRQVRARDIAMRWEEYEELDAQHKTKIEQQERERRERRERVEAEQRRLEEIKRQKEEKIKQLLIHKYRIPEHYITSITTYSIQLSRVDLETEADTFYATIQS